MEIMGPHKQATVRSINLFVTVACHSSAFQLPLVPSASLESNCRSMHLVRFSSLHPCNVPYWKICLSVANTKYVIPICLCVLWSTQRVWAAPKSPKDSPQPLGATGFHLASMSNHPMLCSVRDAFSFTQALGKPELAGSHDGRCAFPSVGRQGWRKQATTPSPPCSPPQLCLGDVSLEAKETFTCLGRCASLPLRSLRGENKNWFGPVLQILNPRFWG